MAQGLRSILCSESDLVGVPPNKQLQRAVRDEVPEVQRGRPAAELLRYAPNGTRSARCPVSLLQGIGQWSEFHEVGSFRFLTAHRSMGED